MVCVATLQSALLLVSSSLGVLGSAFIMLMSALMPRSVLQKAGAATLLWMSVSDFFLAMVYLVQTLVYFARLGPDCPAAAADIGTNLCWALGMLNEYFTLTCIMWTTFLGLHMHWVLRSGAERPAACHWPVVHAICWLVPAVIVYPLGVVGGAFGSADNSCWIKPEFQVARFGLYFVPMTLCIVCSCTVYWRTYRRVRWLNAHCHDQLLRSSGGNADLVNGISGTSSIQSEGIAERSTLEDDLWKRFVSFLLAFGLILAVQLANRLNDAIWPGHSLSTPGALVMSTAEVVVTPIQGLADGLIYARSPHIQAIWKPILGCFGMRRPSVARPDACV